MTTFRDTTGLMRWNRENRIPRGLRGVTRAILKHNQTVAQAEAILVAEHGVKHRPGEHGLCPECQRIKGEVEIPPQIENSTL